MHIDNHHEQIKWTDINVYAGFILRQEAFHIDHALS